MGLCKRVYSKINRIIAGKLGSAAYWSVYSVAENKFNSREDSLNHFYWRSDQYIDYLKLMPVSGLNDRVVLDFGCGPGNDIVGFIEHSKPIKLIGADVSNRSLEMANNRLALHPGEVELIKLDENDSNIPLPSNSVDYIHTSGVLHHVKNLKPTLRELFRILKPEGELRVMVYNYYSVWFHLNTAYIQRLRLRNFGADRSLYEIFRSTTDGKECPISNIYKPDNFLEIVNGMGFEGVYLGSSISMHELNALKHRFDAILDIRLEREHRDFLVNLVFDDRGIPCFEGEVAGIDACFSFKKPKD